MTDPANRHSSPENRVNHPIIRSSSGIAKRAEKPMLAEPYVRLVHIGQILCSMAVCEYKRTREATSNTAERRKLRPSSLVYKVDQAPLHVMRRE